MDTKEIKQKLREEIITELKKVTPEQNTLWSQRICYKLIHHLDLKEVSTVIGFYPLPTEVNVLPFLQAMVDAGKVVALPYIDTTTRRLGFRQITDFKHLQQSSYRIAEPAESAAEVELNHHTMLLIPGLAFDKEGNRLGRGEGYFDKTLGHLSPDLRAKILKIGVCFHVQIIPVVPTERHDMIVSEVVTD